MPICIKCGTQISDVAQFCPRCGAGVATRAASEIPVVSPSAAAAPALESHRTPSAVTAGLPENIAGMLAYFVVPAILFLLIQPFKRNRFVRFHSVQCVLTVAVLIVLQVALASLGKLLPLLVLSLYGLLILADLTLWLLLLFKAYQHETFKLPLVGDIAESYAAKN